MCDYSLQKLASRPAKVGDKLVTTDFGTGTKGFADVDGNPNEAVCVMPGTEIAFDDAVVSNKNFSFFGAKTHKSKVAIFRQINLESAHAHHDALEFPDGEHTLLTSLAEGQRATVLQLPAAPRTEAEAQAQKRLPVKA